MYSISRGVFGIRRSARNNARPNVLTRYEVLTLETSPTKRATETREDS